MQATQASASKNNASNATQRSATQRNATTQESKSPICRRRAETANHQINGRNAPPVYFETTTTARSLILFSLNAPPSPPQPLPTPTPPDPGVCPPSRNRTRAPPRLAACQTQIVLELCDPLTRALRCHLYVYTSARQNKKRQNERPGCPKSYETSRIRCISTSGYYRDHLGIYSCENPNSRYIFRRSGSNSCTILLFNSPS